MLRAGRVGGTATRLRVMGGGLMAVAGVGLMQTENTTLRMGWSERRRPASRAQPAGKRQKEKFGRPLEELSVFYYPKLSEFAKPCWVKLPQTAKILSTSPFFFYFYHFG